MGCHEDCDEKYRRQTLCPPALDTTLRSMTSRSTVARPFGRDAVNDRGVEIPPTSPVQHYRDAVDIELCQRRAVDVTSCAQCGAIPPGYHPTPRDFHSACVAKEACQNLERYSEFDFNFSAQPAQVSIQQCGNQPGHLMYRETSCPPSASTMVARLQ